MTMSPLQVGREGSNWAADGGARFHCLSMVKNSKVRHTHKAQPRAPRLGVMMQRRWNSGERMGRRCKGGVHMEISTTQSKQDTCKDSRAARVRPISLCRVLTPEKLLRALHASEKWQVREVMYR